MDKINPEIRKALVAIQKEILMNISIHQFLVTKLRDCQEYEKSVVIETRKDYENKIKELDQKQKKLLAIVRSNNSFAKPSVNQEKDGKPPKLQMPPPRSPHTSPPRSPQRSPMKSPQKLINYPAKRPLEEDFCSESLKKKKSHKKAFSFPVKERVEQQSNVPRENCLSKEEEERLISYGCFYVFSQQTKLTRPLTEQDYFLMNFGLVSRDHIQYAPFDVACNVRRTRRQAAGSRSKYGASEWEMTHLTAKNLKSSNETGKKADRNIFVEERPVKMKGKGKEVIVPLQRRLHLLSNSPDDNSSMDNKIQSDKTFYSDSSSSQNCSFPPKADSLKIFKSDDSGNKENNSDSSSKLFVDMKIDSPNFQIPKAENKPLLLPQKIEPIADERKLVTEESKKWSIECNTNSSKVLDEREVDVMKKEAEILSRKTSQEWVEDCFSENTATSGKDPRTCDESMDSENLGLRTVAKCSGVKNDCFLSDYSIDNTDTSPANEGVSSQDSGISIRSNVSDTFPNMGFPSMGSQELSMDNDLFKESASLKHDLLLPDVFREQVNMV